MPVVFSPAAALQWGREEKAPVLAGTLGREEPLVGSDPMKQSTGPAGLLLDAAQSVARLGKLLSTPEVPANDPYHEEELAFRPQGIRERIDQAVEPIGVVRERLHEFLVAAAPPGGIDRFKLPPKAQAKESIDKVLKLADGLLDGARVALQMGMVPFPNLTVLRNTAEEIRSMRVEVLGLWSDDPPRAGRFREAAADVLEHWHCRWPRYQDAAPVVLAAGALTGAAFISLALAPGWIGFLAGSVLTASLISLAYAANP
jgi:hypothetical protein